MGSSTFFTPTTSSNPSVTVGANAAVTWTNDSGVQHDVVFDNEAAALAVGNGSAGNIPLHTSGSNQRQFAAAGTYPFHCTIHGSVSSGMRGFVTVQ
jgi:plastocyanin